MNQLLSTKDLPTLAIEINLDNQEPLVKQSNASVKGDTSSNITCGDATQLVGVWFVVINEVPSETIRECAIRVDSSKQLTGSCGNNNMIKDGSIAFNNQCLVTFTINFTDGVIGTSSAMINKAGDLMIGTYKNSYGWYGSFSGILSYTLGKKGPAGGVIFYMTDDGLHGLEAAPVDLSSAEWGCSINNTSTAVGTGAANTAAIIAGCNDKYSAAKKADDYVLNGYSDWFLPSIDELDLLFEQSLFVDGFVGTGHWSSSEFSVHDALFQGELDSYGGYGDNKFASKSRELRVRPVRAF